MITQMQAYREYDKRIGEFSEKKLSQKSDPAHLQSCFDLHKSRIFYEACKCQIPETACLHSQGKAGLT